MNMPNLRRIFVFFQGLKGGIVGYVTIFTGQKRDKKTSRIGLLFAGNCLSIIS
jgi:hypothetical protein